MIEYHQRECPAAQQHIGTPGPARRVARAHHAEEGTVERCPVGGIEGARCIDARDSLPARQGGAHQRAHQRRGADPQRADELGEPATRKAPAKRAIERGEAGGKGIGRHRRWGNDLLELGAKLGYVHSNDCH